MRRGLLVAALALASAARADDGASSGAPAARTALAPLGLGRAAFALGASSVPPDVEEAIGLGLAWLATHQSPDGRWECASYWSWCDGTKAGYEAPDPYGSPEHDVGVTGLALSAFLGAGHVDSGPYADAVTRGLAYLRRTQDPEGCLGDRRTQKFVYDHAVATVALLEAYAMKEDPALRIVAQKALDFVALARNPYFAWRYGVKPGDNDTSVTSWMATALWLASRADNDAVSHGRAAPFQIDHEAFEGIKAWIDKMTDKDYGRVGYIQPGSGPVRPEGRGDNFPSDRSESITAIGCFLRLLNGEAAKSEMIKKGIDLIAKLPPTRSDAGNVDMVHWYYGSLALFHAGAAAWKPWSEALRATVVSSQRKDGTPCRFRGSWDPLDPWGAEGGRVYATALLVLALETPFRFESVSGGAPQFAADLAKLAKSPKAPVDRKIRALLLLYDAEPKAAQKALSLEGPDAAVGLGAVAARPAWALENAKRLLTIFQKGPPAQRVRAVRALGAIPPQQRPGEPDLVAATTAPDADLRRAALEALQGVTLRDESVKALEALLASPDADMALCAAGALLAARPESAAARETVLAAFRAPDAARRSAARRALGAAAPPEWATISAAQLDHAVAHRLPPAFENAFGMRFVLVPPGVYAQGSPPAEKERLPVETLHEVEIPRALYVQVTEVSNAQLRRQLPKHHAALQGEQGDKVDADDRPAIMVSHGEAILFADWLSEKDPAHVYRLPTEAEWEYVARAGTATRFWWGDDEAEAGRHENVADTAAHKVWRDGFGPLVENLPAWRWFDTNDGHVLTAPVASFPPNPWGLHDVLGNVAEWCSDWDGEYPAGRVADPKGPSGGAAHVHRGGSFIASPQMARCAMRELLPPRFEPGKPCPWIGVRLVAETPPSAAPR